MTLTGLPDSLSFDVETLTISGTPVLADSVDPTGRLSGQDRHRLVYTAELDGVTITKRFYIAIYDPNAWRMVFQSPTLGINNGGDRSVVESNEFRVLTLENLTATLEAGQDGAIPPAANQQYEWSKNAAALTITPYDDGMGTGETAPTVTTNGDVTTISGTVGDRSEGTAITAMVTEQLGASVTCTITDSVSGRSLSRVLFINNIWNTADESSS